jgi:hypothetical protein
MPYVLACSTVAGSVAAWMSSPLDMVKLRIQIQRRAHAEPTTDTLAARCTINEHVLLQSTFST